MSPRRERRTNRDLKMRKGLMALLVEGSVRRAAAASNISYRTIAHWAASTEGQRLLNELRSDMGAELAKEFLATARLAHRQLRLAIEKGMIAPAQLPLTIATLTDKAKSLAGPAPDAPSGPSKFTVVFGGARPQRDEIPLLEHEGTDPDE